MQTDVQVARPVAQPKIVERAFTWLDPGPRIESLEELPAALQRNAGVVVPASVSGLASSWQDVIMPMLDNSDYGTRASLEIDAGTDLADYHAFDRFYSGESLRPEALASSGFLTAVFPLELQDVFGMGLWQYRGGPVKLDGFQSNSMSYLADDTLRHVVGPHKHDDNFSAVLMFKRPTYADEALERPFPDCGGVFYTCEDEWGVKRTPYQLDELDLVIMPRDPLHGVTPLNGVTVTDRITFVYGPRRQRLER